MIRLVPIALVLAAAAGCGYHIAGRGGLMPKTVKTICIPAMGNATNRYKLPVLLTGDITREFLSRTRFLIVPDPNQADAILSGAVVNFANYPTIIDPVTNRATGVQAVVTIQLTLTDRRTGAVLFSRSGAEFRERYEIATDPQAYFDESGTGMERLSKAVARSVVSAILEGF
jgi:hypothetical protein